MKKLMIAAGLFTVMSLPLSTAALAAPDTMTVETGIGPVLAGGNGMTLYTFRKDTDGQSNCYDACASAWPPFIAKAGATADGNFGLIQRKTGEMQWAKDGKPLYFWVKDTKKGDRINSRNIKINFLFIVHKYSNHSKK